MTRIAEIEQQLAEAESRRRDLIEKGNRLTAQVALESRRAEAALAAELTNEGIEIEQYLAQMPLLQYGSWAREEWGQYVGAEEQSYLGRVMVGFGAEDGPLSGERPVANMPMEVPLLDAPGALIFKCTPQTKAVARSLMHSIVLRSAVAMPGEVDFRFIDPLLSNAFPMKSLLERREPGRTLSDDLQTTLSEIRFVLERTVRNAERFSKLSMQDRGGQKFDIICAVDFPHGYARDPRLIDQLLLVANSGPRAGRHLLLELDETQALPRDFNLSRFENAVIVDCGKLNFQVDLVPDGAAQDRLIETARNAGVSVTSGDWDSLIKPDPYFALSSARRLETPLGQQPRVWFGKADDGKEISHAMVAGQTGSGKTMLLHTMITGLAARYAPKELRLSLVDLKRGVEFRVYENLPHAEVVCLNAPPVLALSVLADFEQEMIDRYAKFGDAGVTNLEEYRRARPAETMPRKLMVVDEYQKLVEADLEGAQKALENIIRQGRAAGLHLVLASQQFDVRGLTAAALDNVQALLSMQLSHAAQQSLTLFGSEGKRLIRSLEKHHVMVNLDSGKDGGNWPGAVARMERRGQKALDSLVDEIIAGWRSHAANQGVHTTDPILLDGSNAVTLAENPFVMEWRAAPPSEEALNQIARTSVRSGGFGQERWSPADRATPLWLGRKFDVRGHAMAALRRAPSENLLAIGAETEKRLAMLANALAALVTLRPAAALDVTIIDGLQEGYPGAGVLRTAAEFLNRRGAHVEIAAAGGAEAAIAAILERGAANPTSHRVLVVSEPEYLDDLQVGGGAFGPPPEGAPRLLRTALQSGPSKGLHVVLTASSLNTLRTALRPATELNAFNHRVVQQMSTDDSMGLFGGQEATRIKKQSAEHPMGAMLVNMIEGARAGQVFHSYGARSDTGGDHDAASMQQTLERIFG